MAKLTTCVSTRGFIGGKLDFIRDQVKQNATKPMDLAEINIYMKEVDHWKSKLDDIHLDITILNPADLDDHKTEFEALLTKCREVQHGLRALQTALPIIPTIPVPGPTPQQNAKLPKLEIKTFTGGFLDWMTFKDTFEASVHNNTKLPKIEKFAYLKSFTGGEAAQMIGDFASTDANYDLAWVQLNDRYQNCNKIYTANMDRFCKHPRTSATAKSINSLVDSANRCIRSMELLGLANCRQVEAIMVYHMVDKLDDKAKDLWEHSQQTDDIPQFKDLCKFLLRHAIAIEDRARSSDKPTYEKVQKHDKQQKATAYHTQAQTKAEKCKLGCNHSHPIFKCRQFMNASIPERWEIVKHNHLCFKCFKEDHSVPKCERGLNCKKCNKPHNTMLHSDNPQRQNRTEPPRYERTSQVYHTNMHQERVDTRVQQQQQNQQQHRQEFGRETIPPQQQGRVFHTTRNPERSD